MVSQSLLVRILMATNLTLMRLGIAVGSLMPGHGRGCVRAEPARVAHEGSLIGVFEPHVFVQSSFFYRSIITHIAPESRTNTYQLEN